MVSKQEVRPDVKVRTLPMQVASHLVRRIAAGELTDEHVPSELDITQQFGVSRVVARETLKILSSLDIVHIAQGRRLVLRPAEEWDYLSPQLLEWLPEDQVTALLREFQETRLLLEPELAARAATMISKSSLRRLNELVDRMLDLENSPEDYLEVDHAFHMEICRASQNRILDRIMYAARWLLATSRRVTNEEPHGLAAATAIHREILEAIESADAERARQVMHKHMELNIQILGKPKRTGRVRRRPARP
ncbi:GntR family transcriptional regulator [Microlunatus endophyticus]|uniref:GntR family transcriptional regulator n=1 Tax=Microlunatus endophyticus TaxID=1716077 RepID=A0A917W3Q4_9ACTN|nr:FCD domain-containing protein [Microlunatus endophyticus]GGL64514.1 GntR family transcriptional regulator [Microlunatus endophyticus]